MKGALRREIQRRSPTGASQRLRPRAGPFVFAALSEPARYTARPQGSGSPFARSLATLEQSGMTSILEPSTKRVRGSLVRGYRALPALVWNYSLRNDSSGHNQLFAASCSALSNERGHIGVMQRWLLALCACAAAAIDCAKVPDHYATLNVTKNATHGEIRVAARAAQLVPKIPRGYVATYEQLCAWAGAKADGGVPSAHLLNDADTHLTSTCASCHRPRR